MLVVIGIVIGIIIAMLGGLFWFLWVWTDGFKRIWWY